MLPITAALRSVRRSNTGRRDPRLREAGSFILLVLVLVLVPVVRSAAERVARKSG
jgi:hypothetical protein